MVVIRVGALPPRHGHAPWPPQKHQPNQPTTNHPNRMSAEDGVGVRGQGRGRVGPGVHPPGPRFRPHALGERGLDEHHALQEPRHRCVVWRLLCGVGLGLVGSRWVGGSSVRVCMCVYATIKDNGRIPTTTPPHNPPKPPTNTTDTTQQAPPSSTWRWGSSTSATWPRATWRPSPTPVRRGGTSPRATRCRSSASSRPCGTR